MALAEPARGPTPAAPPGARRGGHGHGEARGRGRGEGERCQAPLVVREDADKVARPFVDLGAERRSERPG